MSTVNPIVEKIKKLLALADNHAASEGERDNALRMVAGLLTKHNLTMHDVEASKIEQREEYRHDTYGMPWCRSICSSIAKLFFCNYYMGNRIGSTARMQHFFVGKASNVVTASLLADFIIRSVLRECSKKGWSNLGPETRSFAVGASDAIRSRVNAMMQDPTEAAGSKSTALVVVGMYKSEQEANEAFLQEQGVKLVTHKGRASNLINGKAYGEGKQYGGRVSLDVQVGQSPKPLMIGNGRSS